MKAGTKKKQSSHQVLSRYPISIGLSDPASDGWVFFVYKKYVIFIIQSLMKTKGENKYGRFKLYRPSYA